jgi:signal peptidase II
MACVTLLVVSVNFFVDRITKNIAVRYLKGREPAVFFDRLAVLVYAENDGAFLSLGSGWNIYVKYVVLLIIPILLCIFALVFLAFKEKKMYRIISGGCVIGGGLSNLIDRLFNNFTVIDFLNFGIGNLRTGVLNTADLSVTFGVIALVIFENSSNRRKAAVV